MSFKVLSVLFAFLALNTVEATTSAQVFAKYPNKYFIESGSCRGDGIIKALQSGFAYVYSIELAPHLYDYCREKFASCPNVILYQGDSSTVLPMLLEQIDAPATFWLDAHYSFGDTAKGDAWTPILKELECIRQHFIKTHTILIDDIRECGTKNFGYVTLEEIQAKILQINPAYQFFFEDGYVPKDVIVAKLMQGD
jgi:hypothetical protein